MSHEGVASATGLADPVIAQKVFDGLAAKAASGVHQPARVTLTIELGTLSPEVFKALQTFVAAAVSGGPAVGASKAAPPPSP